MALQFTRLPGLIGQALWSVPAGDREIKPDRQKCLPYLEEQMKRHVFVAVLDCSQFYR